MRQECVFNAIMTHSDEDAVMVGGTPRWDHWQLHLFYSVTNGMATALRYLVTYSPLRIFSNWSYLKQINDI